jgi:serine/threonine-protein kinase HipA
VALGNLDAHAKNYSIQHIRGAVALSPLYDVSPTRVFLAGQRHAALAIGGKQRFDEITRSSLLAEARSWRMPEPAARVAIDDTLDKLSSGLEQAKRRFPATPSKVLAEIERSYRRLRDSA